MGSELDPRVTQTYSFVEWKGGNGGGSRVSRRGINTLQPRLVDVLEQLV